MEKAKLVILIVAIFVLSYIFRKDFPAIFEEMKKTSISTILVISLLAMGYHFVEGLNFKFLGSRMGDNISAKNSFFCSLYSAFYRIATLGSGTYLSIINYLHDFGVPTAHGFAVSTISYMLQKPAVFLSAVLFSAINASFANAHFKSYNKFILFAMVLTGVISVFLLLIVCSVKFHKLVLTVFKLDKKNKFASTKEKLENTFTDLENVSKDVLKSPTTVLFSLLLNMMKYVFYYLIFYHILHPSYEYSFLDYATVVSLSLALSGVIPAPAGVGSTEYMFGLLFSRLMKREVAMSAVFLFRFANFVLPSILGLVISINRKVQNKLGEK